MVVWDREDYLKEANSQLSDKDVYREVKSDAEVPLMKVIIIVLRKKRNRGDNSDETLDYFLANEPRLGWFYSLPKIHKSLHNVPGRKVFIMFQADMQYTIQAILLRISFLFLISI